MTSHWFNIIHDKFAVVMQTALDAFGWPFIDGLDISVSDQDPVIFIAFKKDRIQRILMCINLTSLGYALTQ
jgi:hypothetical protein